MTYTNIFLNDLPQQSLKIHIIIRCLIFFVLVSFCINVGLGWFLLFVKASVMLGPAIVQPFWKCSVSSFPSDMKITCNPSILGVFLQ